MIRTPLPGSMQPGQPNKPQRTDLRSTNVPNLPPGMRPGARPNYLPTGSAGRSAEDHNPLRKVAFFACLGMIVTRFGMLPEVLFYALHVNTYLLYMVAPPAILGAIVSGGLGRTFQKRAAWFWLAFFAWMILATPFSSWRGSSTDRVLDYARFAFPMLIITGGLVTSWKEVRAVFYTLAAALLINAITVRLYGTLDDGGRLTLEASGSIGNSNDLAAHFVLLLPFALFVLMDKRGKAIFRFLMLAPIAYGLYVVLSTGSRGGMLAMGAMFLFMLVRASGTQRMIALVAAVVLAVTIPLLLPGSVMTRLSSLFGGEHEEATESKDSRAYLFHQSVVYSLQNPLVGVGPDQFPNYEGTHNAVIGSHGQYHATHCAFTQVSSECGIPALIFFLGGVIGAFFLVSRVNRRARKEGFTEIANASFCFMLGMTGYFVAITFLANAYSFYLPAIIGFAISLSTEAQRHMNEHAGAVAPAPVMPAFALRNAALLPVQRP